MIKKLFTPVCIFISLLFLAYVLDKLIIGNCYLDKNNQDPLLKKDYTKEFELD